MTRRQQDKIAKVVAETCSITFDDIHSRRRTRTIAEARQLAMYLMRQSANYTSLNDIGGYFGKDHTTVIHAIHAVAHRIQHEIEWTILHAKAMAAVEIGSFVRFQIGDIAVIKEDKTLVLSCNGAVIPIPLSDIRTLYLSTL